MPTLCRRRVPTGANRTDKKIGKRERISRPGREERNQERTQVEQPTNVEPQSETKIHVGIWTKLGGPELHLPTEDGTLENRIHASIGKTFST